MSKVEDWGAGDRLLSFGWLILWVLLGSALLARHNPVVGLGYLALWALQYVSCRYLVCTRCYYYGRKCYMLGGDCAKLLFAPRPQEARQPDDALVGIWWAVVTLYPVPFLVRWKSWWSLALYALVALGWHIAHHFIACRRCKNTHCLLNPDRTPGSPA